MNNDLDYYDWNKTLSYDADVTMVVGTRGVGKTYGLRKQFIRDYLNSGYRFVEVVRFKNELSDVQNGYFNKIESNNEFEGKIYKTEGNYAYIADKPQDDSIKPKWELIGYFIAMTKAQAIKKRTFNNVKRIVLDEAILDRHDKFHRYLVYEFSILANIVDTVSRERPGIDCIKPRLYLLGNALDVMNPYFMAYNIGVPQYGYTWHRNKTMLLHYLEAGKYTKVKAEETVAGRMLQGTEEGRNNNSNEFSGLNNDFIMKKTKCSKFSFGIIYMHFSFAIWEDWVNGYYFVTSKIPKNTDKPVFAITLDDNRMNYIAAKKAEGMLKGFTEAHYCGIIRYETIEIREKFAVVLEMFGVR